MNWADKVQAVADTRKAANKPVWHLIQKVGQNKSLTQREKEAYLRMLYGSLSDKDVPQILVDEAARYHVGTSFRSSINDLRRVKVHMRRLGLAIFPGGNPKLKDRDFAHSLGVPVPETYAVNSPFDKIELVPKSIIKPIGGSSSMGVMYVDDQLQIHSIKTGKVYASLDDAKPEIHRYNGRISADKWLVEQAILTKLGRPANDFKAYAFYGVSGLFLEIDRSIGGSAKYATYNESGEQLGLGPRYVSFPGNGIPEGLRAYARKLSLAAPVPFLRLDFHSGENGVYLGEITPHPGGTYSGELYDSVDSMLGQYFAEAKARLIIDLLNGKRFPEFQAAYDVEYPESGL